METLLILILLVIVIDIASFRWGFDSTEKLGSPEWERRVAWRVLENSDTSRNEKPWGKEYTMSTNSLSIRHPSLDAQTLEAFYSEQLGLIYRSVYRKVGNRQEAEDLTSTILLKAVRLLQPEGGPERMGHWLVRVARTTLIDYWRSHTRVISSSLEALQEAGWEGPVQRDPFGLDGRPTERVQGLLQVLPENEREVLTSRFLLGLSTRETAVRMGLTEGNVRILQHRALKRAAALADMVNCEIDR